MLGTRGCRVGLVHPEIYEMQVRAIVRAALADRGHRGGDHAPAGGIRRGAAPAAGDDRGDHLGGGRRASRHHHRHHDRGAAGGADRRRDRRRGRLLLVRHQRPHPDDAGVLARRCRERVPAALPGHAAAAAEPVRDARPVGSGAPDRAGDRRPPAAPTPGSSWVCAASTEATPPRSSSSSGPASTTSPARPTACRPRGWPPRRPRWRLPREDRRGVRAGRGRRHHGGHRDRRAAGHDHDHLCAAPGIRAGAGVWRAGPGPRAGRQAGAGHHAGRGTQMCTAGGFRSGQLAARVRGRVRRADRAWC